jgi:glycosyltransferase involved in cell wall biosynthesis
MTNDTLPMTDNPVVSVCVPTYNQAAFVEQTLMGALMQETDFAVEIVIGDDGSTDGAAVIIRAYADQHPGRIRAFLHPHNLGPAEPPAFAGRNNALHLLRACRGEFVALCEGDDYWTDPHKLQKQTDLLRANPGLTVCHHNVRVIYEDGLTPAHLFNPPAQPPVSTLADVLADRWFFATGSWLYRNIFRDRPADTFFADWFAEAAAGDWALMIQLAAAGDIAYLPDVMAVYRRHPAGLSHVHSERNAWFLQNRRAMFLAVDSWLGFRYHAVIEQTVAEYDRKLQLLSAHV